MENPHDGEQTFFCVLDIGGYAIFKMRAPVRSGALSSIHLAQNRVCFAIRSVKMYVAVCTGSWETVHLHSHQEHTNSPPAQLFTTRRPGLALHPTPQHLKPRGFPLNRPPCPPTPLTRIFKAVTSQSCRLGAFFDRSLYNGSRARRQDPGRRLHNIVAVSQLFCSSLYQSHGNV